MITRATPLRSQRSLRQDPGAKQVVTRSIQLAQFSAGLRVKDPDTTALVAFLAKESEPELLFKGHSTLREVYSRQAAAAEGEAADAFRAQAFASTKACWKHCPEEAVAGFGNAVAWSLWEDRTTLDHDMKAFALVVATRAADASGDDPNVIDTLACCLFMNGRTEEAVAAIDRCIARQPDEAAWRERREMFLAPSN